MRALAILPLILLAGCLGASDAPKAHLPMTGAITGIVVTESIAPVLGANVTLVGGNTTLQTNETGEFRFDNLDPGSYVVVANAPRFLEQRINVDVFAGNTSQIKLQLPANTTPLPSHQSTPFAGFAERHAGNGTQAVSTCRCDFQLGLDSGWTTLIVEATWTDSIPAATGPTEYAYRITAGEKTLEGTSTSPLNVRLDAADAPTATSATLHIEPGTNWVYVNQKFDVLATVWYGEPAPQDWANLGA